MSAVGSQWVGSNASHCVVARPDRLSSEQLTGMLAKSQACQGVEWVVIITENN